MLNPNLTLKLGDRKASFELPVYFLTNKDAGLMGGIFASYSTDADYHLTASQKNIGFGLFIGGSVSDLLGR